MIRYVVTLFFLLLLSPAMAKSWGEEMPDFKNGRHNNLDSLVVSFYNNNLFPSYSDFAGEFILNDSTFVASARNMPDSVYMKRLGMLNSAIHLPYNDVVRNYITVYTNPKGSFKYILGRAQYYMPMFEEELFRNDMPTELKMLPVIESALNPSAVSPMGAAGLWQFMYATGKYYGLKQDSFIDQRLDPRASTRAACKYLKDLYRIYGDWTLALAAYNCGPGNVNKALARAGNAKSYWDIYYLLPAETRGYVPAFIAATYAYTFYKAHDMTIAPVSYPILTDTIMVSNRNIHFKQISSTLNISDQTLRALNPAYRLDIVPAKLESYPLVLPMDLIGEYINREPEILAKDSLFQKELAVKNVATPRNSGTITHTVKKGEYLGAIARKYKVTVTNLKKWNGIKSDNSLRIGQRLKIVR